MPMNPRLLVPRATFDPDAAAYLRAVEAADGQVLETPVKRAVDDFFKGCKADPSGTPGRSNWDAIKASCILCGARTITGALVPLVGAAPTNNSFLPEDYNRETGLIGNGSTKYLDSNRANDADPQDDSHLSVYYSALRLTLNATKVFAGADGSNVRLIYGVSPGVLALRANGGGDYVSGGEQTGLIACSRNNSENFDAFVNGDLFLKTAESVVPESGSIQIFGRPGASPLRVDARLAFYSIGESLDLEALDSRVTALVTAIGAAL